MKALPNPSMKLASSIAKFSKIDLYHTKFIWSPEGRWREAEQAFAVAIHKSNQLTLHRPPTGQKPGKGKDSAAIRYLLKSEDRCLALADIHLYGGSFSFAFLAVRSPGNEPLLPEALNFLVSAVFFIWKADLVRLPLTLAQSLPIEPSSLKQILTFSEAKAQFLPQVQDFAEISRDDWQHKGPAQKHAPALLYLQSSGNPIDRPMAHRNFQPRGL